MSQKTAIITGAGSGIGRACAQILLDNGWRVGLVGRREEALLETAEGFKHALPLPCDVTDEISVDEAFDKAHKIWGRLDLLFNNAGRLTPGKPLDEIPVDEWRAMVDVNLNGAFLCARKAFSLMRHQSPQGGRIINNGSVSAYVPRPGTAAYAATKHAISGLTKTISLDGRGFSIACGQIDIGNAATDMVDQIRAGVLQADGSIKGEPVMEVPDIARAFLYMAELPEGANVQNMTVMATNMPFIGRG